MKLIEIINEYGWRRMQEDGEWNTPQLKPIDALYDNTKMHDVNLYALNGVCVITIDNAQITDLFGIAKTEDGYRRRAQLSFGTMLCIETLDFLDGFKQLHSFRHNFVYVREEEMHFDGIGKRVEDAGQLYFE